MYPSPRYLNKTHQGGFSLPVVVFILVIMALLATAIVELASRSSFSATQEELSNRAFYAAESGAQWGMSRLFFIVGGTESKGNADTQCGNINGQTLNFSGAGLASCSADITCVANTAGTTGFYSIQSEGSCGTAPVNAVRTIEVGAKIEGP